MRVDTVPNIEGFSTITRVERPDSSANSAAGGVSFKDTIKKALAGVNDLQLKADDMAEKLATGELEDVHQAMLAMNKAKLTFDFTVTARNKVLEAYQEIMRMQI